MKLSLTTGIIPSLNVSAGLLGFFFVKTWTKLLSKSGLLRACLVQPRRRGGEGFLRRGGEVKHNLLC
jgi:hypothetical protein